MDISNRVQIEVVNKGGRLTKTEQTYIEPILSGLAISQMAEEKHVSPRTAEYHYNNLRHKFDAANGASLVARLIQKGFVRFLAAAAFVCSLWVIPTNDAWSDTVNDDPVRTARTRTRRNRDGE